MVTVSLYLNCLEVCSFLDWTLQRGRLWLLFLLSGLLLVLLIAAQAGASGEVVTGPRCVDRDQFVGRGGSLRVEIGVYTDWLRVLFGDTGKRTGEFASWADALLSRRKAVRAATAILRTNDWAMVGAAGG